MLPTGMRLGPYQIVALLGRGGMGEVYRAKDLRLGREVAVKILPERLAQNPDLLARFEREARAVAVLAHPNIVVLHDFGEEQGISFAVTELLEGVNLRGKLAGSCLPWREAIEIGVAVAAGLAVAHSKGIIHRDLKPENLFLTTDGQVKILDFGLARVHQPPASDQETAPYLPVATDPGMVMGTVGYMSPEQLRGQPVDARSDLFSLGCVLYELVAGQRPFPGPTPADISAAILHADPLPLTDVAAHVPPAVERVIGHCLAKQPPQRFPSAHDLGVALRALLAEVASGTVPTAPHRLKTGRRRREAIHSLAVLPFVNSSTDPETDYLSDGITESIINLLSQLPKLRVMARSTVFRYQGKNVDALEVGRALKVRAVLTGQLILRHDRLILKMELVDVKDGSQLWGEHYNRELAQIVAVQKTIAEEIAETLRLRLSGALKKRLDRPVTPNPEAYQSYLQGRYHWNKRTEDGLKKSITFFEEAIEKDPTYAPAYTGIADANLNLGGWGYLPCREAYGRAKAAAMRALEFDDQLAEAHVSLAMVKKEHDWDWPGAGREYQKALQLNPNYAVGHQWYGEYLAALGHHTQAIAALQRAIELDPLALIMHATLGRHGYFFARQHSQATVQLKKTLAMDENFWVAHHFLGFVYATSGQLPEALAEFQTARRLNENLEVLAGLGYTHGLAGHLAEAQQVLDELNKLSATRYVSPMLKAVIAMGMADNDRAFALLENAYEDRAQMLSEIKVDAMYDPLRSDPRWVTLLNRVGLESAM